MADNGQLDLPLPFPELSQDEPLMPARMVNEYVYCPRLAYLQWVQGEWADSADTIQGKAVHKRVDRPGGDLPSPEELDDADRLEARSITLSSNKLGLIARLDLIESDDGRVIPIDYKRGKRPHVAKGAYDPERVQLCVQGMLLQEQGYRCEGGILYFVGSRERVQIPFDDELRTATVNAISGLRLMAQGGHIPPPLEDSPKCPRCALVSICLPDEIRYLNNGDIAPRPVAVPAEDALPAYIQQYRGSVRKRGEVLEVIIEDEKIATIRLMETSQLVLMGNIGITTPTIHELLRRDIPVVWHSYSGWFLGHTVSTGHKNVELRTAQYRASFDERRCLQLARVLIHAKIMNARTLLRRNWRHGDNKDRVLQDLKRDADNALHATSLEKLLGHEGSAARNYFSHFSHMLKKPTAGEELDFDFTHRNRRPPTDPVNAMLSYAYALLVKSWTVALSSVGFDPYRGYYHQPRYGRPALALDMMEPFRPIVADSCVIKAINNGEVKPTDFKQAAGAVALDGEGKKRFIATFERRMSEEITHPLFGYKLSYRRLLEMESRLLGRHLLDEMPRYQPFRTR